MKTFIPDENAPILVEFVPSARMKDVCLGEPDLKGQSEKAVKSAMNTIYNTAKQVTDVITSLEVKPSLIEVEFGISLNAETGALIAKIGMGTTFNVKMAWEG
jgi:hypothetical protein